MAIVVPCRFSGTAALPALCSPDVPATAAMAALHNGCARLRQHAAAAAPKVDPACIALTSRIEGLRKEGIADKIEKASAKKYKMTQADLGKADQLTKANAEFQARCSTLSRPATTAQIAVDDRKRQPKSGSGAPN